MGIEIFKKHLREKRAVKFAYRLDTVNQEYMNKFIKAVQMTRISAIDIPCEKEVYNTVRKNSKMPIIASSIHPFEILNAVKWGVDGIEIGNYNSLYKQNLRQHI